MKKISCMPIVALATILLGGCADNGSSAAPPAGFTATAGDGRVKLVWTPDPSVEYWLFSATDPTLTAFNFLGLPNSAVYTNVATPFYMCGLYKGTTYYFAANGRIDGGPGGSSSPTLSATPYDAVLSWTSNAALSPANLYGAGYTSLTTCSNNSLSAAGSFAAVGAGGAIFTSADGKIWISQISPVATDLYAVTGYAANLNNPGNPGLRWVAVGAGGASVYSTNGSQWDPSPPSPANPLNKDLHSITQVAGRFFAAGDAGTILSSFDGITWTSHTATSGTTNILRGVTHGAIYVAVGDNGTIVTSFEGNTWIAQTSGTASNLRQVTTFGSIIVAVGDGGTIVTSKDNGVTWAAQTLPGTPGLIGVAAEFQQLANAVADPQLGYISTVQFVAIDSAGNAYTSVNGFTWSSAIITNATGLNALAGSGFGYVVAGDAGATVYAF